MDNNYTHIMFVLDKSGSMEVIRDSTIEGFNSFLNDQKKLNGKVTFSLIQFDDLYEYYSDFENIGLVKPLNRDTYVPRGSTALRDAIGRAIDETGTKLAALPESFRPSKVLFVILTDGLENASKNFTMGQVSNMIRLQTDIYKWQFIFLGANQDAIASASQYSIPMTAAMTFTASNTGTLSAYNSVSTQISNYVNDNKSISFTKEEREEAKTNE